MISTYIYYSYIILYVLSILESCHCYIIISKIWPKTNRNMISKKLSSSSSSSDNSKSKSISTTKSNIKYANIINSKEKFHNRDKQRFLIKAKRILEESINNDDKNNINEDKDDKNNKDNEDNALTIFISALKSYAYHYGGSDLSSELYPIMIAFQNKNNFKNINATCISDWLWSLPRVGFNVANNSHRDMVMLLLHRLVRIPRLTPRQVTTSLGGLARMRFKWIQLPETTQNDIIIALEAVAIKFNAREICNCLHSLSKLKIPWSGLPPQVRSSLLECFILQSSAGGLVSQQGSMTIYSLGLMGLKLYDCTPAVQDHIWLVTLAVVEEALVDNRKNIAQHVSNVIYGAAKFGAQYDRMSLQLIDSIYQALHHIMPIMNEQEVANVIYSFGLMGYPWKSIPDATKEVIMTSFHDKVSGMITQGLSCTIYGLHLMGMKWTQINLPLRVDIGIALRKAFMNDDGSNDHINGSGSGNGNNEILIGNSGENKGKQWTSKFDSSSGTSNSRSSRLPIQSIRRYNSQLQAQETSQSMANMIYSLGCMGVHWGHFVSSYTTSTSVSSSTSMSPSNLEQLSSSTDAHKYDSNSDSINDSSSDRNNGDYSKYENIYLESLLAALVRWLPSCSSQELSNTIYGLGLMKADYASLPWDVKDALYYSLRSKMTDLSSQEVCSTLHGFAKMRVKWNTLPLPMKKCLLVTIGSLRINNDETNITSTSDSHSASASASASGSGQLCLACTIYSLGMMEVDWQSLPARIKYLLIEASTHIQLRDQTLSNVIYGLSLMGVRWGFMETSLREAIQHNLEKNNAFGHDTPQHVSNSLWGLAKMDAHWSEFNGQNLIDSLVRCHDNSGMGPQEIANAIYGLAVTDASWSNLLPSSSSSSSSLKGVHPHEALATALTRVAGTMTAQEVANVMYALAILTFDAAVSISTYSEIELNEMMKKIKANTKTKTRGIHIYDDDIDTLWVVYSTMLQEFKRIDPNEYSKENYDQFAIFFEFLNVIPGGNALIRHVIGDDNDTFVSGPAAGIPSRLHSRSVDSMMKHLHYWSKHQSRKHKKNGNKTKEDEGEGKEGVSFCFKFGVQHEFNGLVRGVFPVDAAVYCNDELVALIEIDGEFHYKQLGQQLRRKDQLKEFLYRCHYPTLPLFRIRSDQCTIIGPERAGRELASWIIQSVTSTEAKTISSSAMATSTTNTNRDSDGEV